MPLNSFTDVEYEFAILKNLILSGQGVLDSFGQRLAALEGKVQAENPHSKFHRGQIVLVRDNHTPWFVAAYHHYEEARNRHVGGYHYVFDSDDSCYWHHCLPYDGNEHLLGTNPDREDDDD